MTERKAILVVEDDPGIRLILRDALAAEGYQVMTAADGQEGLRQALESRPHLILLDVMLPFLDGFEVCRRLRAGGLTSPVMMLTVRDG